MGHFTLRSFLRENIDYVYIKIGPRSVPEMPGERAVVEPIHAVSHWTWGFTELVPVPMSIRFWFMSVATLAFGLCCSPPEWCLFNTVLGLCTEHPCMWDEVLKFVRVRGL